MDSLPIYYPSSLYFQTEKIQETQQNLHQLMDNVNSTDSKSMLLQTVALFETLLVKIKTLEQEKIELHSLLTQCKLQPQSSEAIEKEKKTLPEESKSFGYTEKYSSQITNSFEQMHPRQNVGLSTVGICSFKSESGHDQNSFTLKEVSQTENVESRSVDICSNKITEDKICQTEVQEFSDLKTLQQSFDKMYEAHLK